MANGFHSQLTDTDGLHEPKGLSAATIGTSYVSQGTTPNTGIWKKPNHNTELSGHQGGNSTERYHLSLAQYNALGNGINRIIQSVSTATSAGSTANTDYVYYVSGSTTITLPTAISNTNRYTIKNDGAGTVTVIFTSGQNADGSTTITLTQSTSLDFISNNANYRIH